MKKQATRTNGATKQPVSTKIGRGATKATMGAAFGIGRFAYRFGKGFAEGVTEAAAEVKRGYDEAAEK